jgi:hypothetical protein
MILGKSIILLAAALLVSCSHGPTIAGSGSESSNAMTPNALTGTVIGRPDSGSIVQPLAGASVSLYSITMDTLDSGVVNYTWSVCKQVTTDDKGTFRIDSVKEGYYSAIMEFQKEKAFTGYFRYHSADSVRDLGFFETHATIHMRGTIRDTAHALSAKLFLGLVGTPYADTTYNGGSFDIDNIPYIASDNSSINYLFSVTPDTLSAPVFPYFGAFVLPASRTDILFRDTTTLLDTTRIIFNSYQTVYTEEKSN